MKISTFLLVSSILTGLVLLGRKIMSIPAGSQDSYDQDALSLDESSIRDIAQEIWESEGKPEGQAARHWAMATELLKSRLAADASLAGRDNNQPSADPYAYADKNSIH
jgi:hypothetical protein